MESFDFGDLNIIGSVNFEVDEIDRGFNERMEQMIFEANNLPLPNSIGPKSLLAANSLESVTTPLKIGPKTTGSSSENTTVIVSQKRSVDETLGDADQVENLVRSTKRGRGKENTSEGDAPKFQVVPKYGQQLGDSANLLVSEDIFASLAAQSPEKAQELISRHVIQAAFLQTQFYKVNQEAITQNMANKKKVDELQASLVKEKEAALNAEKIIVCLKEQLKQAEDEAKMIAVINEKVIAAQAERDSVCQELEGKLKDTLQELELLNQMLLKERTQFEAKKAEIYIKAYNKGRVDNSDAMAGKSLDLDFSNIGYNAGKVVKEFKAMREAKEVEVLMEKAAGTGTGEVKNEE